MAKDKKKNSKKEQKHNHMLDDTAKALKKFRRVTRQVTKLTTGQKVVGGVALLAAGLVYLAKKQDGAGASTSSTDAAAAEASLASLTTGDTDTNGNSTGEAASADGPSTATSSTPKPYRKSKKHK